MKICAIICEYNPFHNGHKYQIEYTKRELKPDYIIGIMSGNYVQRGELAIFDKYKRAKDAIQNGVDIIIELPPNHSINNSYNFARKAIDIIKLCNICTHISFGCEIDDLNNIIDISKKIKNFKNINPNISFNTARAKYIEDELSIKKDIMFNSNLILAIEYILNMPSNILPFIVKRIQSNYNDTNINVNGNISSATAIRKKIYEQNSIQFLNMNDIYDEFKYFFNFNLLSDTKIHNRINKYINDSKTFYELIENSYAKNISRSTIKRLILRDMLKLKSEKSYINLLAFKQSSSFLINSFSNVINNYKDINDEDINISYNENTLADSFYYKKFNSKYSLNTKYEKVIIK